MSSAREQLSKYNQRILWLASYPKSGNTWFRAFIGSLLDGQININRLYQDGIFSDRQPFESVTGLDSRLLTQGEVHSLLPEVYRHIARTSKRLLLIKVHDAYLLNRENVPIVPPEVTHKVIYFVRNPLDIVCSFAHHFDMSKDKIIELMNNPEGRLATQACGNNIYPQFSQLISDWSGHVNSWTRQNLLDIVVIKYEDLVLDTFSTFTKVIAAIGLNVSQDMIESAIEKSSFQNLRKMEGAQGFNEKYSGSTSFFRKGKIGAWRGELTPRQVDLILSRHSDVMKDYGYLP